MKTLSIPFKAMSSKSDYACPDGEVAATENLMIVDPRSGSIFDPSTGENPDDNNPDNPDNPGVFPGNPVSTFRLTLPPAPEVEFALKRKVLEGWHIHPDTFPSQVVEKGEASESGWGKKAMLLLSRFEKDVEQENLFFEPFFVMSAVRLKDGTRILPSPPVLMIPNSGAPAVSGSDNFSVDTMKMDVVAAVCGLQWRVRVPEGLKDSDAVAGLDILVSDRIPLYSRKDEVVGFHRGECLNFTHCIATDGTSGERRVASERIVQGWMPDASSEAEIMKAMLSSVDFRIVSEVPLSGLTSTESFGDVDFNCGGLEMTPAYEPYRPDFMHLSEATALGSSSISGRMTAWDVTVVAPLPLPVGQTASHASAETYSPRWVFHPDPYAVVYRYAAGGEVRELPLRRHPNFYGSYYWSGMKGEAGYEIVVAETPSKETRTVRLPGAIWRSVKGNALLFPDSLLMKLDVGKVITVCRAFRASGLVATTSPTVYAFTSEGVYLLKEMDDGTFRDAGLISRHVLRDSASFVVRGKSVEFVTAGGDAMMIEGTVVKSVSGSVSTSTAVSTSQSGISLTVVDENRKCKLTTRPLKLGDAERWKRVTAVRLRGDFDPGRCRIRLLGSGDLRVWKKIAEREGSAITGMLAPRFHYYKVEAELHLRASESIQGLCIIIN